jgi:hypothetical protein
MMRSPGRNHKEAEQMKVTHTSSITAPLERVVEALCGEGYNVESERMREGVISTEYRLISRDDQSIVFEMHTDEYARKKTGGLDTSRQVKTILKNEYLASNRTLSWRYQNARGPGRLRLGGVQRLTPQGETIRMEHTVEVELDIPLIGGKIATFIARAFQKELPNYDRVLRKHVDQLGRAREQDRR